MSREEFDTLGEETARALGSAVAEVTRLGLLPELNPFKNAIQAACERLEEAADDLRDAQKQQKGQLELSISKFAESLGSTARELETNQRNAAVAVQDIRQSEQKYVLHVKKVRDEIRTLEEKLVGLNQLQESHAHQMQSEFEALDSRVGRIAVAQDAMVAKELPSLTARMTELNQAATQIQDKMSELRKLVQSVVGVQEKLALTGQVADATERITLGQARIVAFTRTAMILSALALLGVLGLVAFNLLH